MAHSPPIPRRKPSALTLGQGSARTAWPDLDPSARLALLNEILAMNPAWTVSGGIDAESSLEPLLIDAQGELIALDGSRAGNPLFVEITEGTLISERNALAFLAIAAIGAVLVFS